MASVTVHVPMCAADGLVMAAVLLAENCRSFNALPPNHPLTEAVNESCDAVDRAIAQFIKHGGEPVLTHMLAKAYEFGWEASELGMEVDCR
jgi:hypothetical protein